MADGWLEILSQAVGDDGRRMVGTARTIVDGVGKRLMDG